MQKCPLNSIIYICTRALQSFLSFTHYRTASTVIPLLPKVIFTPSVQPNIGLPRTRLPLTSAINTLLVIYTVLNHSLHVPKPSQYSLIGSTRYLPSVPALLRTSSFLTLSIRDTPTKLLKQFISRTFTILLSALLIPHASAP